MDAFSLRIERETARAIVQALGALCAEIEADPASEVYIDPMIHGMVDGFANAPRAMVRCESLQRLVATAVRTMAQADICAIESAALALPDDSAQVRVGTHLPASAIVSSLRRYAQGKAIEAESMRKIVAAPELDHESPWGVDEHVARDSARWAREAASILARQIFPLRA